MKYHLTPLIKHQHPASSYEGLNLGATRMRLTQPLTARLGSVRRVQLSYDTKAKIICITPAKITKGPPGHDTFRITKDSRGAALIHCTTLCTVMPQGRYRLVEQTPEGHRRQVKGVNS